MAKLGESYIAVLADLSKFDKSLDRQVDKITQRFERDLNRSLGKRLGANMGAGAAEGLNEALARTAQSLGSTLSVPANRAGRNAGQQINQGIGQGMRNKDPITRALASIVAALEDGFSALPAELKAVAGASIIALGAPLGAILASAIGAGVVAGLTGIGVALAFQFDEVEQRGIEFADSLRVRLVSAASSFGNETLNAIDELDYQIAQLEPTLKSVFDRASVFADPLAQGVGNFLDEVVSGLDRGLAAADIDGLIDSLVSGFEYLGLSIGDAFDVLLSNPNLDDALFDLFILLGDLVTIGAEFLTWSLDAYQDLLLVADVVFQVVETAHDLYEILNAIVTVSPGAWDAVKNFFGADDREFQLHKRVRETDDAFGNYNRTANKTITATEAQKKTIRELNRALDEQRKAARGAIDSQIDYERSLDDVTAALKRSKGSLDITKESGRQLAEEYLVAFDNLDKFTDAQVVKGKMTEEQAKKYYDAQIKRLRDEFKARGGNLKQFDELFADYIRLAGLPPIPDPTKNLTSGAENAFDALAEAYRMLGLLQARAAKGVPGPGGSVRRGGGSFLPGFEHGGFISQPSIIMAGENYKREVVLPETDPRRSMELLGQSSLAGYLGGGVTTVYAVFDGEPFQARMVRTAQSVNRSSARTLSQIPRNI